MFLANISVCYLPDKNRCVVILKRELNDSTKGQHSALIQSMQQNIKYATLKDLELELWLRARNKGMIVWSTKTGDLVPINKMSNEHLLNTIKMLYRHIIIEEEQELFNEECLEALSSIGDTVF